MASLSAISLLSDSSFASIHAAAYMEVSDMVITPTPGTHVTPVVPGSLHLNFSGVLANLADCPSVACQNARGSSSSEVRIDVIVDNSIFSGDARRIEISNANGSRTEESSSGLLTGYLVVGPGPLVLTVPNLQLPVNQPFHLGLNLFTETTAEGNGVVASADFFHTLSFPTVGPVFDLPSGYTVNSVDGFIQDNQFVGGVSSVPEPATWLLLATGCLGLLGYGWRHRQQMA